LGIQAKRFTPSQFDHAFSHPAHPLPSGVTGIAGAVTGATLTKDKGEVLVGFVAETAVRFSSMAEVGMTFESSSDQNSERYSLC